MAGRIATTTRSSRRETGARSDWETDVSSEVPPPLHLATPTSTTPTSFSPGGTNAAGATWQREISVHELDAHGKRTGELVPKLVTTSANIGQAGQTAKLDLIAQVCESERPSKRDSLSEKQVASAARKQQKTEVGRTSTLANVEKWKDEH